MNQMKEEGKELLVVDTETVMNLVYTIRGQQVMLDSDLAELYGYEVKRLNEQVRRNINRFPEDFMFQLTANETESLRSQFATANINVKSRTCPYVFTEQGIYIFVGDDSLFYKWEQKFASSSGSSISDFDISLRRIAGMRRGNLSC